MRFFTPIVFLAMAVFIHWYGATHEDRALVFPFISSIVPSSRDNPKAMADASATAMAVLGAVFLVRDLFLWLRERRRPPR